MNTREYPELAIYIIANILVLFLIIYEVVGHFERNPSCFDCSDEPLNYDPYADAKEYIKELEAIKKEKENKRIERAKLGFLQVNCQDGIKEACEEYKTKKNLINLPN